MRWHEPCSRGDARPGRSAAWPTTRQPRRGRQLAARRRLPKTSSARGVVGNRIGEAAALLSKTMAAIIFDDIGTKDHPTSVAAYVLKKAKGLASSA